MAAAGGGFGGLSVMPKQLFFIALAAGYVLLSQSPAVAQTAVSPQWNAMDWIDGDYQTTTPSWQKQQGINWTRVSCRITLRNTPQKCVNFVTTSPTPGIAKYFLYIQTDSSTLPTDALQYSALSAGNSSVESVGFDDFFSSYEPWYAKMPNAAQFVSQVIDNLKSANPNLKFGITLYENELDPVYNPFIDDNHLPPALKAKFDYIHLFLHYRKNGPHYADYVAQVQTLFPKAAIIAGVYTYDRIDYFPCAQNDPAKKPCTPQEEIDYFQKALDIQVQLLKQGKVVGLELFPGYFGNETNLFGPGPNSDNLACNDVARCVNTTLQMRDAVLAAHNQFMAAATPSPLAVTPGAAETPRVFPNPWRVDRHRDQLISFDHLPPGSTVKLFTVSGHLVRTLPKSDSTVTWNLTNEKGEAVGAGLYVYLVNNDRGQSARGQLAIIR
jgi:hypothetical protein